MPISRRTSACKIATYLLSAFFNVTNHVTDRLSELRDLSSGQAKFRPFDAQQPSRINPLAVTVLAPNKVDLLKNAPGPKFGCS